MWQNDPDTARRLLNHDTWAVVGLTGDPSRAAYGVARWLQQHGKRIVPVNPRGSAVLGEPGYLSVADIPFPVDVVDVFRRSEFAGHHADEAIAIGADVWFQLGVLDEAAAQRVDAAGREIVMDTCPKIEAPRLGWAA
ncbi:MAG TPA: CoA-binding protein [Frankiaceae bacterium]|nr:CoA-binding protein [Frankiaceae bacterium]